MTEIFTYNTESNIVEKPLESYGICTEKHPALHSIIPEYTLPIPNPVINKTIQRLQLTLRKYSGIGLSANQCGVYERVMVLGTDHFNLVCINPKIIWESKETEIALENCLSFPGLTLKIERPKEIGVEYLNGSGILEPQNFQGVTSRIFQHQLDILNGILYTSKVGPVALRLAKKKQELIIKKTQRKFR
jgi:peptide deformylase